MLGSSSEKGKTKNSEEYIRDKYIKTRLTKDAFDSNYIYNT